MNYSDILKIPLLHLESSELPNAKAVGLPGPSA